VVYVTKFVHCRILEEAIKDRVPPKTIEVNLKAFELGFNKVSEDLRG